MIEPTARPEPVAFRDYSNVMLTDKKILSPHQFYAKSLSTALAGEAFVRTMDLEPYTNVTDHASYLGKKFDDFTGLGTWVRSFGAEAKNVSDTSESIKAASNLAAETDTTAPQAAPEVTSEAASSVSWAFSDFVPQPIQTGYNWATSNVTDLYNSTMSNEWFLLTCGIALTAAAINHVSAKKIESNAKRGFISIAGGVTAALGTKFLLSYFGYSSPDIVKAINIGARIPAYSLVLNYTAPILQKALCFTHNQIRFLQSPFGFEDLETKKSK